MKGKTVQSRCLKEFWSLHEKFRINFYKSMCTELEKRPEKITVLESMTLDVIDVLENPTVNDVARFLEISQPNAAYKVGTLEKKGFIIKEQSTVDRREYFLRLTDKYRNYSAKKNLAITSVFEALEDEYSEEKWEKFEEIVSDLNKALEPAIKDLV